MLDTRAQEDSARVMLDPLIQEATGINWPAMAVARERIALARDGHGSVKAAERLAIDTLMAGKQQRGATP